MNVKIMDRAGMVFTFQDVVTVHTINASNTWEMMRMTENKRRKEKQEDGE